MSPYRYPSMEATCALRSPIVDMSGHLDVVSPEALRCEPKHLEWFSDKSLGSVVVGDWANLEVASVVLSRLKDGGTIVCDSVTDEVVNHIKTLPFRTQVTKYPDRVVLKRLSGKPSLEVVPSVEVHKKTACLIRYGAIGDMLMMMPLIDALKADGYHITLNTTERGRDIFRGDSRIDSLMVQESRVVHPQDLVSYWKGVEERFDLIVNMSGRIEGALLPMEGEPAFKWCYEDRQERCDRPYFDEHFAVANIPSPPIVKGFIQLSDMELSWAQKEVRNIKQALKRDKLVAWHPLGSSQHKAYPWSFDIFTLMRNSRDTSFGFVALGDALSRHLVGAEFSDIVCNKCDKYTIRQSMAIHSAVDAVLTPETWGLCAGFAFDAPVVALLSHSSVSQWPFQECDWPMTPDRMLCPCYPCHRIHKSRTTCPYGVHERSATLCMDSIPPTEVYNALTSIISSGSRRK